MIRFEIIGLLVNTLTETTSILIIIERIERYQFKSNYLKNCKNLALFRSNFWTLNEISNIPKRNEPNRSSISESNYSEIYAFLEA